MTGAEGITFERLMGQLQEAVRALQEERQQQEVTCTAHLAITNGLVSAFNIEKGTREAISSAALAARVSIAAEAQTARETIAAEATARQGRRHWIIERLMPFAYPLAAAGAGYFIAKGGF